MATLITESPPARAPEPVTRAGEFAGTGRLVRLGLRRDRIRIPAFGIGFAAVLGASYGATAELYPDAADRAPAVELWNNTPSLIAMFGRLYDPDSIGALATIKLLGFYGAVVGIILVIHMVRHTRGDEDAGRLELVSSAAVGRLAPLAAAFAVATTLSVTIGLGATVGLLASGADPTGSFAFGLAWTCIGLVFAATTAVLAQVAREARPAIGLGVAAVALAYVLRAVGDLSDPPGVATWLSPIGWAQQIRPFAGDRFWVALIPVTATAIMGLLAIWLRRRRDLGAGLLADRPGPASGSIDTPIGLAWRLNRGMLLAWALGITLMGLVIGSLTDSIDSFFTDPATKEWFLRLGGSDVLADAFLAAELSIVTVVISGVGVALINHLRTEERAGRAEITLAGPTSRGGWAFANVALALAAVASLILLAGVAIGIGAAISTGDSSFVGSMILAAATKIPSAWVITGLAVALFGLAPRAVPLVWGLLLVSMVVTEFADLWGLPEWMANLSPFTHNPAMPGGEVVWATLAALTLVAAGLIALGLVTWRRRDLRT